jgi:hypothetical protein
MATCLRRQSPRCALPTTGAAAALRLSMRGWMALALPAWTCGFRPTAAHLCVLPHCAVLSVPPPLNCCLQVQLHAPGPRQRLLRLRQHAGGAAGGRHASALHDAPGGWVGGRVVGAVAGWVGAVAGWAQLEGRLPAAHGSVSPNAFVHRGIRHTQPATRRRPCLRPPLLLLACPAPRTTRPTGRQSWRAAQSASWPPSAA